MYVALPTLIAAAVLYFITKRYIVRPISKIEKDPTLVPDTRTLQLLAQALGLDYHYLLTLNEVIEDDRDLRIIARAKNSLSPEDQTRMMEMLRTAFDTAFADAESDGIDEADLF